MTTEQKKYRALTGINWPDPKGTGERRAEAKAVLPASAFKPSNIKAFLEMGAIEEVV